MVPFNTIGFPGFGVESGGVTYTKAIIKRTDKSILCLKCENLEFLTFDTCATDDKETPRFGVLYI